MKNDALIGFSGFVGSTLMKQCEFGSLFRSTNIHEIDGRTFDTVVCAGAPAQKWLANKEPQDDLLKINNLIEHLKTIKCKTFVLISTVDVFKAPIGVDESSTIDEEGLHAYGLHRRLLEKFVEKHFSNFLIVRLPGLVGPGLKKNIIFDFLNNNDVQKIDSRNVFQFYPMINLWFDIQIALEANLSLIHLTSEPISVEDVSVKGFGKAFTKHLDVTPVSYDMTSIHGNLYSKDSDYQYTRQEVVQAIRCYAQSEPGVKADS